MRTHNSATGSRGCVRALSAVRVTTADGTAPGGTVVTARLGHIDVSRVESNAQRVTRTAGHGERPGVLLVLLTRGSAVLMQNEGPIVAGTGDLLVWDEAGDYSFHCGGPFTALVLRLSRSRLGSTDDPVRSAVLPAFVVSAGAAGTAGTAGLLATVVSTLATSPASYAPSVAGRLADSVVELLSIVLLERARPEEDPAGDRAALVRRVREHVDRNLQDTSLSPRSIARDHHISVRYLHRVFESEDVTVQRLIQRRRIERSARDLARHELRTLSVAAIALRWGFTNPAHFSRAFRRRYGRTPMEWRMSGGRG